MACRGISEIFEEGDLLQLDFENAYVKNLSTGRELNGQPLALDLINIIQSGGILEFLKLERQVETRPRHDK